MNWNLSLKFLRHKRCFLTISLLFTSFCVLDCCCCCAAAAAAATLDDVGGVDDEGHTVFMLLGDDEDGEPPEPTPEFNECWYIIESPRCRKRTKKKKHELRFFFLINIKATTTTKSFNNFEKYERKKINNMYAFSCVCLLKKLNTSKFRDWPIWPLKQTINLQCYFFLSSYNFYWTFVSTTQKNQSMYRFFGVFQTKVSICTKN